jgi:hypothetical protein
MEFKLCKLKKIGQRIKVFFYSQQNQNMLNNFYFAEIFIQSISQCLGQTKRGTLKKLE